MRQTFSFAFKIFDRTENLRYYKNSTLKITSALFKLQKTMERNLLLSFTIDSLQFCPTVFPTVSWISRPVVLLKEGSSWKTLSCDVRLALNPIKIIVHNHREKLGYNQTRLFAGTCFILLFLRRVIKTGGFSDCFRKNQIIEENGKLLKN